MKKHNDCPPETLNTSPSPESSSSKHGLIATIRDARHVPPDDVPESPDGVEPISLEQQRAELHHVPDGHDPELAHALVEIERQSGELPGLCGVSAPNTSVVPGLSRRIADLTVTTTRARDLHVASATQLKVARSDAHRAIKSVASAVRFAGEHNPKVLTRWAAVLRYDSAHGASVVDGREKAKRARESAKKADAKKAESKPASDKPTEG